MLIITKSLWFSIVFIIYFNEQCNAIYLINVTSLKKIEHNPAIWTEDEGIWGPLLEDWTLSSRTYREKRVMQLPLVNNENILLTKSNDSSYEKESKINPGKIIVNSNRPSNPKPLDQHVSEADLYLLGAIEKLVFRVDTLEKRLKRVEEMLYYMMAGNRIDHEPCPNNFTRVSTTCYLFHSIAGREYDWKAASKQCKKLGAKLAELETIEENQDVIAYIQTRPNLHGKDFWTGGLNPGLLWIWTNSARPVVTTTNKKDPATNILGDGRCLRLSYDHKLRGYSYRGTDCSIRYSHICEIQENDASNEIRRLGKSRNILQEDDDK